MSKSSPDEKIRPAARENKHSLREVYAKGTEFLIAVTQPFFCKLCSSFCSNEADAKTHVLSVSHNEKYEKYIRDNPRYERSALEHRRVASSKTQDKRPHGARPSDSRKRTNDDERSLEKDKKPKLESESSKSVKLTDVPVTASSDAYPDQQLTPMITSSTGGNVENKTADESVNFTPVSLPCGDVGNSSPAGVIRDNRLMEQALDKVAAETENLADDNTLGEDTNATSADMLECVWGSVAEEGATGRSMKSDEALLDEATDDRIAEVCVESAATDHLQTVVTAELIISDVAADNFIAASTTSENVINASGIESDCSSNAVLPPPEDSAISIDQADEIPYDAEGSVKVANAAQDFCGNELNEICGVDDTANGAGAALSTCSESDGNGALDKRQIPDVEKSVIVFETQVEASLKDFTTNIAHGEETEAANAVQDFCGNELNEICGVDDTANGAGAALSTCSESDGNGALDKRQIPDVEKSVIVFETQVEASLKDFTTNIAHGEETEAANAVQDFCGNELNEICGVDDTANGAGAALSTCSESDGNGALDKRQIPDVEKSVIVFETQVEASLKDFTTNIAHGEETEAANAVQDFCGNELNEICGVDDTANDAGAALSTCSESDGNGALDKRQIPDVEKSVIVFETQVEASLKDFTTNIAHGEETEAANAVQDFCGNELNEICGVDDTANGAGAALSTCSESDGNGALDKRQIPDVEKSVIVFETQVEASLKDFTTNIAHGEETEAAAEQQTNLLTTEGAIFDTADVTGANCMTVLQDDSAVVVAPLLTPDEYTPSQASAVEQQLLNSASDLTLGDTGGSLNAIVDDDDDFEVELL